MKRLLTMLILLGLVSFPGVASAANLLTNASFEDATQSPWNGMWGSNQHTGVYGDTTYAHSGSQSIKVTPNSNSGTGDDYYTYPGNLIAATPGQTFYGYYFAKTESLVNEDVFAVLDWFNGGAWIGGASGSSITGTNDWTSLSVTGAAPASTTHVALTLRVYQNTDGGSGTAYWDDAYLDSNPIPEPTSMLLLGTGLIGLFTLGRKKIK